MDITPSKKELLPLVKQSAAGEILLPEFQRNFVWGRDDIRDLLVSIVKNYFIGTFLFLRADYENTPFAMRPIAGVLRSQNELRPEWMVLDGQQRITSLYYVFHGPDIPLKWTKYPYRFFLDLQEILKGNVDDAIFSERADYCDEYYDRRYQFEHYLIPFTELLSWESWRQKFEAYLIKKDQEYFLNDYHPKILPVWNRVIDTIRNFPVPVIELPRVKRDDPEQIAEVCAIFEKMNSTGVELSVYDLLTARLWKFGLDLHQLWANSLEKYELLKKFSGEDPENFGVFILRAIALMRDKEVKSKVLITLEAANFEEDWSIASQYVEKALRRITSTSEDGFGVTDTKWFPYTTMTPVLAALLHFVDSNKLLGEGLRSIKKWYWGSVFLERYAGATDTTARKDYVDLCNYIKGSKSLPDVFQDISNSIVNNPNYSLKDTTRRNAVYKGVMNLTAKRGAKDFLADDSLEFWELDDHHIFPQAYLSKQKRLDEFERNTVLNKTLISSTANRKISRSKPSDYTDRLIPQKRRREILSSHFIDEKADHALAKDDYSEFLKHRENEILKVIKALVQ